MGRAVAAIDKKRVAACFGRAGESYDSQALAQRHIHQVLLDMLAPYAPPQFGRVLEIGCGTAAFSRRFIDRFQTASLTLNDLSAQYEPLIRRKMPSETALVFGDAEQIDLGGGYDLLTAASSLQWLADQPAFLRRAAQMLTDNGLLLFNTFSADNLHEIKTLTGIGLHYPDETDWRGWLAGSFDILDCRRETLTLTFADARAVLRHLRQTGVNGIARQRWHKSDLADFSRRYEAQFAVSDGLTLTYAPLYVLAKKK